MRARTKLALDVGLVGGGALAWLSGLVLLTAFHMGPGRLRPAALGLSRLAWQNLHRVAAVVVLVALVAHVVLHARPMSRRFLRVVRGRRMRHDLHELGVYAGNATVVITGCVAWALVGCSLTLIGSSLPGPFAGGRHACIDVHHLTALAVSIPTLLHAYRRWGALSVLSARTRAEARSPGFAWPWQRPQATRFIGVDLHRCQACADCVGNCPRHVLGMVAFWHHRHVRIERADACTGCGRCVRACNQGAITTVGRPGRLSATGGAPAAEPAHGHSA